MKTMNNECERDASRKRLEEVYRDERPKLLRRARRLGAVLSDAEDIVQDAFVSALSRVETTAPIRNATSLIYSATRNRVIDLWRRDRTRREAGQIDVTEQVFEEIVSETGLDPQDALVREELVEAVVDAIESLPEKQRSVIVAQVFEGTTFRELSARTGVSIETLAARKRLAIRSLGKALREWIVDEGSGGK